VELARPIDESTSILPPEPDFRYVGLEPGPRRRVGLWASLIGAGASIGAGALHGFGLRGAVLTAITAAAAALALRRVGGPRVAGGWGTDAVAMAIVPWGILVEPDGEPRVLRWAAVKKVHVQMIHGRDQATPTTLWSVVTVETDHEKLVARSPGAVSIDRLLAHLSGYAEEQSHAIAIDLDGETSTDGATEPYCEPLIAAARAYVDSAPASTRLSLPPGGYRHTVARAASPETIAILRDVLRDRSPRATDPRAFAAVIAGELHATALAEDLVALVQAPHPVIAAVARAAAHRLGVATARAGALDEVAPFLEGHDVDALTAWMRTDEPKPAVAREKEGEGASANGAAGARGPAARRHAGAK
jgi:hypothetical protein